MLELSVSSSDKLGHALLHIWPQYLAYVTSFVTIGIIWMNHHHTVSLIARTDRTMLFINNLLLLTVAFLPFPDEARRRLSPRRAASRRPRSPTPGPSS